MLSKLSIFTCCIRFSLMQCPIRRCGMIRGYAWILSRMAVFDQWNKAGFRLLIAQSACMPHAKVAAWKSGSGSRDNASEDESKHDRQQQNRCHGVAIAGGGHACPRRNKSPGVAG